MSSREYDTLIRKGIEPELFQISGSMKQYKKDVQLLAERFAAEFAKLKRTPAGRKKLKLAGLGK
jgi:hypothetical protein